MKKPKRVLLVLFLLVLAFAGYVELANRKMTQMTYRQKFLRTVYPAFMWLQKKFSTAPPIVHADKPQAPVSFYSLSAVRIDGQTFDFSTLKGRYVLLVNTASDCGYTNQYAELQQLQELFPDKLVILGFPANDFKEQEKGTDAAIAEFCKVNYGVGFPLMQKSVVIKKTGQHPVFAWLTDSTRNGWNTKAPSWNFSKYLVNPEGQLTHYLEPSVSPLDSTLTHLLEKN